MDMLETIRNARDNIDSLGEYIARQEKLALWGKPLVRCSPVEFALELIAVRDAGREAAQVLTMLEKDIESMLEVLKKKDGCKNPENETKGCA
jgi:hypothetical protein